MLYWNATADVHKQWQDFKGTCELKSYAFHEKRNKTLRFAVFCCALTQT